MPLCRINLNSFYGFGYFVDFYIIWLWGSFNIYCNVGVPWHVNQHVKAFSCLHKHSDFSSPPLCSFADLFALDYCVH